LDKNRSSRRLTLAGLAGCSDGELTAVAVLSENHRETQVGQGFGLMAVEFWQKIDLNPPSPLA
jgi:hypothetical protein